MGKKDRPKPKVDTAIGLQIWDAIEGLRTISGRMPFIIAVEQEMARITPERLRVRNDIVLRLVRDSFDMLVVDLASQREAMTQDDGILNQLVHHLDRIAAVTPEEMDPAMPVNVGPRDDPHGPAIVRRFFQRELAEHHNSALRRLFPDGGPRTQADVTGLVQRFRDRTEPIDRDRNEVRAHRYERQNPERYLQPKRVEEQIGVFLEVLSDLFLVIEHSSHAFTPSVEADAQHTAEDIADLVVHGSINDAVNHYGVLKDTPETPPPWFWAKRENFYKRGDQASPAEQHRADQRDEQAD